MVLTAPSHQVGVPGPAQTVCAYVFVCLGLSKRGLPHPNPHQPLVLGLTAAKFICLVGVHVFPASAPTRGPSRAWTALPNCTSAYHMQAGQEQREWMNGGLPSPQKTQEEPVILWCSRPGRKPRRPLRAPSASLGVAGSQFGSRCPMHDGGFVMEPASSTSWVFPPSCLSLLLLGQVTGVRWGQQSSILQLITFLLRAGDAGLAFQEPCLRDPQWGSACSVLPT